MPEYVDLTDEQWETLDLVIPKPVRRKDGRGRPWRGRREVLNGILYILHTGSIWADLPPRYPPYQTCHRRFQQWVRSGVMSKILQVLSEDSTSVEPDVAQPPPGLAPTSECVRELR
jgi:transposase